MAKRCDCILVRRDNPDKTFSELIEMGLICDVCANSYREFSKLAEEEGTNPQEEINKDTTTKT